MRKIRKKRGAAAPAQASLPRALSGRRILVAGDVILDRYLWGDVERTSPEAPVPVVRLRNETHTLGGAANVVANLAALGAKASLVGVVGADAEGARLREKLAEIGVSDRGLAVDRARRTTVKTRVISLGQQLLRLDQEEDAAPSSALRAEILARFKRLLVRSDLVILSDYGKGVLAEEICGPLIALAAKAGKPVVVDPKGLDYRKYRNATVIKPNKREAEAATGIRIDSPRALERAARSLFAATRAKGLVISRGGEGATAFEPGRAPVHLPSHARTVYDVTGAGDSFIAAMSLALAAGAPLAEAARIGNAAGSVVVGKLGAATAGPEELMRALEGDAGAAKLRTEAQLASELTALRASGKRIVFTNGFFDLIHLGHLKFLEQARGLGDVLVVAINSDSSVRKLKGPPRPVLGEKDRAAVLAALDWVDYVVIFSDETPERLLSALRPDVLVKGKALARKHVVGGGLVDAWGGRVVSLPQLGELTTDAMLERIGRQATRRPQKSA